MLLAALLLAGAQIEEAEHALAAGRVEQAERMLAILTAEKQDGDRLDLLRAGVAGGSGRHSEALALYASVATRMPGDLRSAAGAARAAFELGRMADARHWSDKATSLPGAGWRDWNLCGAISDRDGRFDRADQCYGEAQRLAPGRAEVRNNRGWSVLLRGRWSEAADLFRAALATAPDNVRIRRNLELAEAAVASDLPLRRAGESAADYAARLNDAGVIAAAAGDSRRARAALANALTERPEWSERTARNLSEIERR